MSLLDYKIVATIYGENSVNLIENLLKLQEIDQEIFHLQDTKEKLPKKLGLHSQELQKLRQESEVITKECEQNNLLTSEIRDKIEEKKAQISKLGEQLQEVKSMQECTEILTREKAVQDEIEALEKNMLEQMEKAEVSKQKFLDYKKKLHHAEHALEGIRADLQKEYKQIEKKIEEAKERRLQQKNEVEKIDAKMLQQYERVLARNRVPLINVEEGSCGHCHIELLPNQIALLSTGQIIPCKDCFRLMYLI